MAYSTYIAGLSVGTDHGVLKIEIDDTILGNECHFGGHIFGSESGEQKNLSIVRGKEDLASGDHTLKVYWKAPSGSRFRLISKHRDQIIIAI